MTLRGEAAIVGMGELPTRRTYPGRTTNSLCTEAARLAIADAGLRKEDVDGLITRGSDVSPMDLAEYMGLHVGFCEGVTQHGSSGATRWWSQRRRSMQAWPIPSCASSGAHGIRL
jgi:hypothetical protein